MKKSRRNFIKTTSLSIASLGSSSFLTGFSNKSPERKLGNQYMGDFKAAKIKNIRAAFIGVGARGGNHLKSFASLEGTEVVAISDLYEDNVLREFKIASEIGDRKRHQNISLYWGDENKWKTMLKDVKPDIVFVATNWNNHAVMAIESMKSGAHAFVEVPIATNIKDLWNIVDTSEETKKHCMMLENVNYGRDELMFLNICRKGLIGELLHGEASYIHDLRFQMREENRGTGSWRTLHYANSKGNLYPTHGLGPVSQYMNLARGEDNFKTLVSFSSPALGRRLYAKKNYPKEHKWNKLEYKNGDLSTSIIKTSLGRTIMVQWDETSPRPYTRLNLIQGTKGILAGFPTRIALEEGFKNLSKDHHSWIQGKNMKAIYEEYDHPLYKKLNDKNTSLGKQIAESGHGGMDGIMIYRIVECLQNGLPMDQNVYEGCFWSAVTPLSADSIDNNGAPQSFPDFTRGNWEKTEPLKIIS